MIHNGVYHIWFFINPISKFRCKSCLRQMLKLPPLNVQRYLQNLNNSQSEFDYNYLINIKDVQKTDIQVTWFL